MADPTSPSLKDLPKVTGDFKSELESFKTTCLKNTDTQEKIVLPTAEDVAQERQHNALIAGVENFNTSSLKRTNTKEKIVLPNAEGQKQATAPNYISLDGLTLFQLRGRRKTEIASSWCVSGVVSLIKR